MEITVSSINWRKFMSKIGSVSFKMMYVIMVMILLFSVVPAQAAPSAPSGQDPIPPAPSQDLNGDVPLPPAVNVVATTISSKYNHTCVITESAGMKCWGDNAYGQLGNNSLVGSNVPVDVLNPAGTAPLSSVTSIAVGQSHTCALAGGGVYCWGFNSKGQLGNGNTGTDSKLPVAVTGLSSGVESVGAGYNHSCAVITGSSYLLHTAKCWGNNSEGQLGDNSQNDSNVPVVVSGLIGAFGSNAISGGVNHTCVTNWNNNDLIASCWGDNSNGQLGQYDNTITRRLTPVMVYISAGQLWKSMAYLSVGANHNLAGSWQEAIAWGSNSAGQLGNGDATHTNQITPAYVNGATHIFIYGSAAGVNHSCVVDNNNAVKCTGDNTGGQLGDSSNTSSDVPVSYGSFSSGADRVVAGNLHTCVLMKNGSVTCAGKNTEGELGNGTNNDSSSPVTVTGLGPAATYDISGTVNLNGIGLAGVTVKAGSKTTTTTSKPMYLLSGLAAGSYTVTPTKAGYTFTPASQAVTITSANQTGINFTATPAAAVGFDSQFNGSMAGWTAVKGVWGVNSTYLNSPAWNGALSASIAYTKSTFSKLDYSARIYRTGCDTCVFGVIIRGSGVSLPTGAWTSGYQFSITRNGQYVVAKGVNSKFTILKTNTSSTSINKLNAWNILRVVANGSSLKFYINGTLVWSGVDTSLTTGKVGLNVISSDPASKVNRLLVDYATLSIP